MTTVNMYELTSHGPLLRMRGTTHPSGHIRASDTVSGKSAVPTTALMVRSLHYRWMERERRWSARLDRRGYVGRLVAFVDMKVDELWKNDNTLLEINTGSGKPLSGVQPEKSFNDGTGKRAIKSLWCKATAIRVRNAWRS
jgi:hypothetical protein